jgi:hypothetical protein
MTDIFKIISTNNYELLEQLIQTNPNDNIFNSVRINISLIYKSIEVRAYECFNLLIDLPNLTILKSTDTYQSGLHIAVTYYMDAPNVSNKYYLDKLLAKKVYITKSLLTECSSNYDIFCLLFEYFIKTKDDLAYVIRFTHNMDIINKIYDWLNETKPEYYNTPINKLEFNNNIFKIIISNGNISMLYFLKNIIKHVDWKVIDNQPSLYYILKSRANNNCNLMFNCLYNEYTKMSIDDCNQIMGIKDLTIIFSQIILNTNLIEQILQLPIDFNDVSTIIANQIVGSINHFGYHSQHEFDNNLQKIYLCLKYKLVKINPFIVMSSNNDFINQLDDPLSYFNKIKIKNQIMINYLKQLKYVFNHFEFIITPPFENIFNQESNEFFVINQKNFIKDFN